MKTVTIMWLEASVDKRETAMMRILKAGKMQQ
jgi:hypothetical protein